MEVHGSPVDIRGGSRFFKGRGQFLSVMIMMMVVVMMTMRRRKRRLIAFFICRSFQKQKYKK